MQKIRKCPVCLYSEEGETEGETEELRSHQWVPPLAAGFRTSALHAPPQGGGVADLHWAQLNGAGVPVWTPPPSSHAAPPQAPALVTPEPLALIGQGH